jgi:hypothetical protein
VVDALDSELRFSIGMRRRVATCRYGFLYGKGVYENDDT